MRKIAVKVLAIIALAPQIAKAEGKEIEVSTIKNGSGLGFYSYSYDGDEPFEIVSQASFQDKFLSGNHEFLNFPTEKNTMWTRTTIRNDTSESKSFYIFDNLNYAREVSIYQDDDHIKTFTGKDDIEDRIVEIHLPPNHSSTIFVRRLSYSSQRQTWTYWEDRTTLDEHIDGIQKKWLVLVTIFGMSLLFNIMLFFAYRSRDYSSYMIYLLAIIAHTTTNWSIVGHEYIREIQVCIAILAALSGISFTKYFLNLEPKSLSSKTLNLLFLFFSILLIPHMFFNSIMFFKLGAFVTAATTIVCMVISVDLYIKKKKNHILIYMIAYGIVLIGTTIQMMIWGGKLPLLAGYSHIVHYTAGVENILMILAMGNKVYSTEVERIAHHRNLRHSYNQLSKVFYNHQITKIQQGEELESTMKTSPGEGFVVSFDIIGSSKIVHHNLKDFLESAIHDCMDILSENYCPSEMKANGYRIKEMGDGFLCSIGYPFNIPTNNNPGDLSIELAYRFVQNLENNVEKFGIENRVFCGIGIAFGELHGYYPKSGTKEYDLFGRGIVHATRYESMRKKMFPNPDCHILILQSQVYDQLSQEKREPFERYDFPANIKVRDDESADHLYFELRKFDASRVQPMD